MIVWIHGWGHVLRNVIIKTHASKLNKLKKILFEGVNIIAHTFNENSMQVSSSCTLREIMFNDNRFQAHEPQSYGIKKHFMIQTHDLASTFDDSLKCNRLS